LRSLTIDPDQSSAQNSVARSSRDQHTEKQMTEGFEQSLATILEQLLDEHDMQPPLVVCTVGDNGSVLVARFNESANLV
jgi:hypothetical protein